jgi:hypothetical protein
LKIVEDFLLKLEIVLWCCNQFIILDLQLKGIVVAGIRRKRQQQPKYCAVEL